MPVQWMTTTTLLVFNVFKFSKFTLINKSNKLKAIQWTAT